MSPWAVPGDCHLWVSESLAVDLFVTSSDQNGTMALVTDVTNASALISCTASKMLSRRIANLHIIRAER